MKVQTLQERVEERLRVWGVEALNTLETESSVIIFGRRENQSVVLKVVRQPCDEWRCGEVLQAFEGRGCVRVYDYVDGAALIERLHPGTRLASLSLDHRDEEATEILAEVISRMLPVEPAPKSFVTVADWGKSFQRYLASGDNQISRRLVEQAQQQYRELCDSQQNIRLLHGDLQHYNVLYDSVRNWLSIDPKGVIGEVEYEIGASLRNPCDDPALFPAPQTIERRLRCYESKLKLNGERALRWSFAQAVLSAIWSIEDEYRIDTEVPTIRLANIIWSMFRSYSLSTVRKE